MSFREERDHFDEGKTLKEIGKDKKGLAKIKKDGLDLHIVPPDNDLDPPEVVLKNMTQIGVVHLEFTQDMKITKNVQLPDDEKLILYLESTDGERNLGVYIDQKDKRSLARDDSEKKSGLDFSWRSVQMTNSTLVLQIDFEDATRISLSSTNL
jgi:hypothetical protein